MELLARIVEFEQNAKDISQLDAILRYFNL
jgi:hypothetical protein